MNSLLKSGLAAMLASYCLHATAQESKLPKELPQLTREGVIADYRLAMDILKKQHPNPYKFIDSMDLNRKVDSLMKLAAMQNNAFAAVRFNPVQFLRDVHTNVSFSEDNTKEVLSNINFFPLPVLIERGKIFVNIKGDKIPYAADLVTINSQPAKDIIANLSGSTYSDGFINTGTDRMYSNFQLLFSMYFHDAKQYSIEYIEPQGKNVKKMTIASLSSSPGYHSTKLAVMPVNQLARAYWIYNSYDDASQTGTITVNSFNLQEAYAYKEFSAFFREVKKRNYKNVIIDIRNNGGGNPAISALLYSFLAPKPFRNVYNHRTRNIDIAYAELATADGMRKMSEEDVRNTKNFLYQRFDKDSASGFYIGNERLKEGLLENFPPDKDAFNGKVYVLTGGGTVSAATYFATLVRKNERGLIIGKETGSGEQATTAAWFMTYILPNTKAKLTVPLSELYFFNSKTDNGKGIIPDKEVPMDRFVQYMLNTQDPEWTYTMELIKGSR
jgi:hypothetical protein